MLCAAESGICHAAACNMNSTLQEKKHGAGYRCKGLTETVQPLEKAQHSKIPWSNFFTKVTSSFPLLHIHAKMMNELQGGYT